MMTKPFSMHGRRDFLILAAGATLKAAEPVTRRAVSETAYPLERITPIAQDGHPGLGFLRKPPGKGAIPGGGHHSRWAPHSAGRDVKEYALHSPPPCPFLAEGYVLVAFTYLSRDHDRQDKMCLQDCLAVVNHLKRLSFVDEGLIPCARTGQRKTHKRKQPRGIAQHLATAHCQFGVFQMLISRVTKNLPESVGLLIEATVMRVPIPLPTDQRS